MMSLYGKHAIICLDAIRNSERKANLLRELQSGQHPYEILELSLEQILHMSANAQCVTND
jgi:hypothetical protein